jgi:diaminopimelate epimerase
MGVPSFEPTALPFEAAGPQERYALSAGSDTVEIGAVSIGNPHAVLQVAAVDSAPVARLGPAIEGHQRFPRRVNVGFMEVVDRADIRLRVYERGAGETLACGTGACAAVIVGRQRGLLDPQVRVHVRGGELRVDWAGPGEAVWLTGPAEVAFEGHFELQN